MTLAMEQITRPDLVWHGRGKSYPLTSVDGYGMQLIHSVPANDRLAMIRASYKIVARCLGLPFDEVFGTEDTPGFSEQEIREIMEIVQRPVGEVEAAAPPNSEPAGENAAAPAG